MPESPQLTAALSDRYVIQREIGAGGMAVVYLAHDRKLDREVALKVLRPELGAVLGAERFLAEIKISARLDHPHILTLIDSGDADGMLYYVLPYVRGETLRDKLKREQQLGIDEAIAITKQVASALDYAHRQGLVHRDIKPENILLQEGEAMLTDFGIALAVKEAGGNRLTQTGLSLGTPQYMSPEQATGDRGIDARSDVYSLASVLYEMLAGEPPVTGASAQAMIAKLMTERPTHVRILRDTVPQGVDDAITKALAKTPADRFGTAEEFARALDAGMMRGATATGAGTGASAAAVPARRRSPRLIGAAVAVVALVVAVAAYARRGGSHFAGQEASLGAKTQLTISGGVYYPAISPDGKQLAYAARRCSGADCLYSIVLQDVGGTVTRPIADSLTAIYDLRWSPDRRNLLFNGTIDSRLGTYLLSALGGAPHFLTAGVAAFYSGGDSLLIGPATAQDSVYWIGVSGLDGIPHDSVAVRGKGQFLAGLSAIPGTRWILTLIIQAPHGLWQVIGRDGKVADHVVNQCTCGGIGSVDAIWVNRAGDALGESLVRIAIDPATGRLSVKQDTMVTGVFTNVSVTADGQKMVMDQGTLDYAVWGEGLPDLLKGSLPGDRRIAHASSNVLGWISPDGNRVLMRRVVPTTGDHTEARFSVRPYDGSSEAPLQGPGKIVAARWADSTSVAVASAMPDGHVHLAVVDVRTGAERNPLDLPDSTIGFAVPVPNGWAWLPITRNALHIEQNGKQRTVKLPAWYLNATMLAADSAHDRLFIGGYNTSTTDTLIVSAMNLSDGSFTRWGSMFAEDASISTLEGGDVLAVIHHTENAMELYRLSGPGKVERIGAPLVPLYGVTVSADLKRATAAQRSYNADAWMYNVVKR
ncbi:MAG: serine/threonine-protein kinase [Gemmatimonadota bacterium]|nr:serine/threonine-protein kinase [Gemmatimonadota bacterium]